MPDLDPDMFEQFADGRMRLMPPRNCYMTLLDVDRANNRTLEGWFVDGVLKLATWIQLPEGFLNKDSAILPGDEQGDASNG